MPDMQAIIEQRDIQAFREGLPQGPQLKDRHIESWMERMAGSEDFHEPGWHYDRLKGIGGSEAVVAVQQGLIDEGRAPDRPFDLPKGLVLEKLLMIEPDPTNPQMLRGNRFEDLIAERFLEEQGAKRRPDLMQRVAEVSGKVPGHPWMVGNPDLIVELKDGRIALVDIKAPSRAGADVDYGYKVQLHHYRRLMMAADIPPDKMILGNFDWPSYHVMALPVAFDERLDELHRKGGDALWEQVVKGQVPDNREINWPRPEWERLSAEEQEGLRHRIGEQEERYLLKKMLADEAAAEAKKESARLAETIGQLGPARGARPADYGLALAGLTTRVKVNEDRFLDALRKMEKSGHAEKAYEPGKQYDVEAMADRLKALGEDPDDYRKPRLDNDKAISVLEQNGIPYSAMVGDIVEETPTLRLTKPKKGERLDLYRGIGEVVETHFDETLQRLLGDQESTAAPKAEREPEPAVDEAPAGPRPGDGERPERAAAAESGTNETGEAEKNSTFFYTGDDANQPGSASAFAESFQGALEAPADDLADDDLETMLPDEAGSPGPSEAESAHNEQREPSIDSLFGPGG